MGQAPPTGYAVTFRCLLPTDPAVAIILAHWMFNAVGSGDPAAVEALLAKGADVNAKDNSGLTALMRASQFVHLDVVQALLAKGADVNPKRNDGLTALMTASRLGRVDVVQALLDREPTSMPRTTVASLH